MIRASCSRGSAVQHQVRRQGVAHARAGKSRAPVRHGLSISPPQGLRPRREDPSPSTDGGSSGPPGKPPAPPKATAEGSWNDGEGEPAKEGFGWQGWRDRVAADPQFAYKVLVEQVIGVGAAVLGDMSTRPNWGLNELDFVFSTLIVGSLMNFLLMYLLAPVAAPAGGAAVASRGLAKLFDERTLLKWGAPGGHIFEQGFAMKGRLINLGFKAFTFGIIGFCAGLAGTCISNGLIAVRQRMDPDFELQNETPNVLLNSLAWTVHMGISSNIRYQLLNGLDMVMVDKLAPSMFRTVVVIIRTLNNVVGGMSFVTCARIVGSQKSAPQVPPDPAAITV